MLCFVTNNQNPKYKHMSPAGLHDQTDFWRLWIFLCISLYGISASASLSSFPLLEQAPVWKQKLWMNKVFFVLSAKAKNLRIVVSRLSLNALCVTPS